MLSFICNGDKINRNAPISKKETTINKQASKLVCYSDDDRPNKYIRIREKKIGDTIYTIIARECPSAKETAFDITKRLIEHSASQSITASLGGCNSGGNK